MTQIQGTTGDAVDPESTRALPGSPRADRQSSYATSGAYDWPQDALERLYRAVMEVEL